MITGKLDEGTAKRLAASLPWMQTCLEWLEQERPWTEETEQVCEGISVKKVAYSTSEPTRCRFENHAREVDLQVVVEGIECIEIARSKEVGEPVEVDADGDVAFYGDPGLPVVKLPLGEGSFAVFFPEDAHRCGKSVDGEAHLRKYVFKISRSHYAL